MTVAWNAAQYISAHIQRPANSRLIPTMPAEIRKRKYSQRNCGTAKTHQIKKRLEAELDYEGGRTPCQQK